MLEELAFEHGFEPTMTFRKALVCVKDRVQIDKKTAVVYKMLCGYCNCVYNGQMSLNLEQRIREHKRALDVDASGLMEHVLKENYSVDWSSATII